MMSKITESASPSHKEHQIPGIYSIQNTVNGKVYVGQSVNLYKRFQSHKRSVHFPDLYRRPIVAAFKKYGFDKFVFNILEVVDSAKADLTKREQFWIDRLQSNKKEFGYNACPVAGSIFGFKQSLETRNKVSIASAGRRHSMKTRLKMSRIHKGKINSLESREKNRRAHLGKKVPHKRGRAIDQLSITTGDVVAIFRSASEAARQLKYKSWSNILSSCRGKRASAAGYAWRFCVKNN